MCGPCYDDIRGDTIGSSHVPAQQSTIVDQAALLKAQIREMSRELEQLKEALRACEGTQTKGKN